MRTILTQNQTNLLIQTDQANADQPDETIEESKPETEADDATEENFDDLGGGRRAMTFWKPGANKFGAIKFKKLSNAARSFWFKW